MKKKNTDGSELEIDIGAAETRDSGIVVADINVIRPKTVPLIVTLPEGASKAQIERAKVLNGFAYQFPEKWSQRKEELIKELESLKDAPDPQEDPNVKLSVGPKIPTL